MPVRPRTFSTKCPYRTLSYTSVRGRKRPRNALLRDASKQLHVRSNIGALARAYPGSVALARPDDPAADREPDPKPNAHADLYMRAGDLARGRSLQGL